MGESVKFRPGRIQSIDSSQEITLKQTWAHLLRYWGYEIAIADEECANPHNFVVSSTTPLASPNAPADTHSGGLRWFKRSSSNNKHGRSKSIESSGEIRPLRSRQGNHDQYLPVQVPSENVSAVFASYKMHSSPGSSDLSDEDLFASSTPDQALEAASSDDEPSLESFCTANSSSGEETTDVAGRKQHLNSASFLPRHALFDFLKNGTPQLTHTSWIKSMRQDLLDNLVLRYLRARKFNVTQSLIMIHKSLCWRGTVGFPDDWTNQGDAKFFLEKKIPKYYNNFTAGKCFGGGHDRQGNPLLFSQARNHIPSELTTEYTDRFALVCIEWTRLFMREVTESVDQVSVVFDLTGFSLKNSDNPSTKFLVEALEAYYPECLAGVYIYNAPWVFNVVWNLVKNWLDPGVSAKIHFIKTINELENYIDLDNLPKEMGGNSSVSSEYPEPDPLDKDPPQKKDDHYVELVRERDTLLMQFIETTIRWIEATDAEVSASYLRDKIQLDEALSSNYIKLDPYVRCRGICDRTGQLKIRN